VLADEPTGDLDTKTGREVVEALRRAAKEEGVAVIAVTHDPKVAERADRVLGIRDGKIVKEVRNRGR
jgi:ABC-type lipoprotein export system ATPase subunit